MPRRIIFIIISLFILSISCILLFVYLTKKNPQKNFTKNSDTQTLDQNKAFPLLDEKIGEKSIEIEELDNPQVRTYRLHITLTEPLFLATDFLKGKFVIKGDEDQRPLYFVLGSIEEGQIQLGKKEGSSIVYRATPLKELSEVLGDKRDLTIQVSFSKLLQNKDDINAPFDITQQRNYELIQQIIEKGTSELPEYTEFVVDQISLEE